MRVLTLAAVCLSLLGLAPAAGAATAVRGAAPSPLPSEPRLLRWTPIEGADGYEVWLIDAGKTEVVYTNVLDVREFYTFHRSASWTSTVRWRIRALRADLEKTSRQNGLPAVG